MATYTPNLNLYKPDSSDDFGDFRSEFNDNMDKIDNAPTGDSVSWSGRFTDGDNIGTITINGTSENVYSRAYQGGNGVEVGIVGGSGYATISLEYLTVINGAVNLVFDDGN